MERMMLHRQNRGTCPYGCCGKLVDAAYDGTKATPTKNRIRRSIRRTDRQKGKAECLRQTAD